MEKLELHGDRAFGDDPAVVGGFAFFDGKPVMVIGQQKGRDTKQKLHRNFGMPKPEGYRKALRLMQLAGKYGRPIVTLLDTPGAYPGIDAEERGQAEAIALNLREMARLGVPIIVVVIGEGERDEDDRVDKDQPPQAIGWRLLAHDRSPLSSRPCEPWPPCMKMWSSGQANRKRNGRIPRKWARCCAQASSRRNSPLPGSTSRQARPKSSASAFAPICLTTAG